MLKNYLSEKSLIEGAIGIFWVNVTFGKQYLINIFIIRQKVFEFVLKTLISNTLCLQIEKKNVEGLIVIVNFFKFLATLFEFFLYFT